MLVVVRLAANAIVDSISLTRLAELAASDELVLVSTADMVLDRALPQLRAAIPRHQVVGLLIDGEPSPIERGLVDDLLDVGAVPLIIMVGGDVDGHRPERWLEADRCLYLPDPSSTPPPRAPSAV